MADLSGRVAVVIDAAAGTILGRGIAAGLTEAGARVVFASGAAHGSEVLASLPEPHRGLDVLVGRAQRLVRLAPVVAGTMAARPAPSGGLPGGGLPGGGLPGGGLPGPALMVCLAAAAPAAADCPAPRLARDLAAELAPRGVTVLALRPSTPGVTGRCIAALAMDPDIAEKSGGAYGVDELAREYRFSDPDLPVSG